MLTYNSNVKGGKVYGLNLLKYIYEAVCDFIPKWLFVECDRTFYSCTFDPESEAKGSSNKRNAPT